MNKLLIGLAAGLALTGCATTGNVPYTPPQVMIKSNSVDAVKILLVQRCIGGGGVIEEADASKLICSKPMDNSFQSNMWRAFFTPNYSTNPNAKARYTLLGADGQVFVTVDTFLHYQTAFGQDNIVPVKDPGIASRALRALQEVKHQVELGVAPPPGGTLNNPSTVCDSCKSLGF